MFLPLSFLFPSKLKIIIIAVNSPWLYPLPPEQTQLAASLGGRGVVCSQNGTHEDVGQREVSIFPPTKPPSAAIPTAEDQISFPTSLPHDQVRVAQWFGYRSPEDTFTTKLLSSREVDAVTHLRDALQAQAPPKRCWYPLAGHKLLHNRSRQLLPLIAKVPQNIPGSK